MEIKCQNSVNFGELRHQHVKLIKNSVNKEIWSYFFWNMQYFRKKKRPKMAEFKPINLATVRHQFIKISVIFRSVAKHTSTYCCLLASGHIRVRGLRVVIRISRIFYDISCAISPAFSPTFSPAFLPHFLPQFLPHFPRSSPAFLPHFLRHFSRFVRMGVIVCQFWMWNDCLLVVGWVCKLLPTRVFHFGRNRRVAEVFACL